MDLNHKRVLIIKPSSLGDVVHALPLAHAIKRKFPGSYVAWIVNRAFAGILEHDPAIDELIPITIPSTSDPHSSGKTYLQAGLATIRTFRNLRKRLRRAPFDIILDLHASFRSGLFSLAAPRAQRVGFSDAKELNTLFQAEHVVCPQGIIHAVDRNVSFARHLGIETAPEDFRVIVGRRQQETVRNLLRANGIGPTERIVYVNACARWATKLWNIESWAFLCQSLREGAGLRVVLGGGPADREYIEAIDETARAKSLLTAGILSLAESAALLEYSSLYVGVDSGPMHIASFVGTPVVALFGPTDPLKVGPYGMGHRVIRREDLACLGCRKRSCENRRCMDELDPGYVARICLDTLALSLPCEG